MAKNFIADKATLDAVDTKVSDIQHSVGTLDNNIANIDNKIGNPGSDLTTLIDTLNTTLNLLNARLTDTRASQLDKIPNIVNSVGNVGIKKIIASFIDTTTNNGYVDINHASVDVNKSFIILNGSSYNSTYQGSHDIYIISRADTSFRIATILGTNEFNLRASYQIVEFN